MKFLYPEFLWALFLVAIPIIIHLFNFRKFQKIYFSNIGLLKDIKLQTQSKSKLKHIILLLIRMFTIIALVLAFCQPYFPNETKVAPGENHISLFIDNSHSMDSKDQNGYRLDLAKEQAARLIKKYGPSDLFQIITNDFEGRHQRFYNKSDALNLIDEITPTFATKKLSEVYARQYEMLNSIEGNTAIFWLSDFQKNSTDFENLKIDSSIAIVCLPYAHSKTQNISIDSIYFETPVRTIGSEDQVTVYVTNQNKNEVDFRIVLYVNEEAHAFINFEIAANSQQKYTIPYTLKQGGVQHCRLEITDYPDADLTFDDSFYFSYTVKNVLKILHVYEQTPLKESDSFFKALYDKNIHFEYASTPLNSLDYSTINQYDLIILSDVVSLSTGLTNALTTYINNGGNVAVFPSNNAQLDTYNNFLNAFSNISYKALSKTTTQVSKIEIQHPIFQGIFDQIPSNNAVDLPKIITHYTLNNPTSSRFVNLMTLQNGAPFLCYLKLPLGSITLCSTPLNNASSNFPKHALFVPTMLRIAEFAQAQQKYSYTVGEDVQVAFDFLATNADGMLIRNYNNTQEFKPELKKSATQNTLLLYDQIKTAGAYSIFVNEKIIGGFSFNYNRSESLQDFYEASELQSQLDKYQLNFISILNTKENSENGYFDDALKLSKYWKWFIVLALMLLAAEILIYRLWK